MSKLKQLLEKATQKNEMWWRVYAYDPAKDNKLVHTSKTFDCINDAGIEKAKLLEKNPTYTIEIVAESSQKNVPTELKYFTYTKDKLKTKEDFDKAFKEMKKAYYEEPSLSEKILIDQEMAIVKTWQKQKFESSQKNEDTFKPGDKVSVKSYDKGGNQFITLRNAIIIKEITEKEAGQLDPAYNWKKPTGMKYYLVKLNTGSNKAVLASDLTLESSQKNETRSYTVTVKLEVPDKMNNKDIEDYIENRVDNSNFGVYVLDVTAERK